MPVGFVGNLGYQPSLREDKHRRWTRWVKDTDGLRAKLQEEYPLATTAAQLSRDLMTLCCHNKGPEAPRGGPIVSEAEGAMVGTKWSITRAWPFNKV